MGKWPVRLLAALFVITLLVVAERATRDTTPTSRITSAITPDAIDASAFGPIDIEAAIARSDRDIMQADERAALKPGEWLALEGQVAARMQRFALTADYGMLKGAGDALASARRNAPAGSGPWLREAAFAMTTHNLEGAEKALNGFDAVAVPLSSADRAEAAAIRGDIAFYRGDMDAAWQDYAAADALSPGASAYRRAILAKSQGRFDDAIAGFKSIAASGEQSPQAQASLAVRIGVIESARGNMDAARAWFQAANRIFPGQPYVRVMLAESKAVAGDRQGAIADLTAVANEYGWAEAMDALAMIYRTAGDRANSRAWSDKAGRIWNERLAIAPLAAGAHAAEHELVFGDPQRALQLAQANVKARPYGEARILYADALIANGRPGEAIEQLQTALREGWRSAPLYRTLAQAQRMTGNEDAAQQAETHASTINPRIFDAETGLVWFGHG